MWAFYGSLKLYLCNKTTYLWILYSKDDLEWYEKEPVLFHGFLSTVIPQHILKASIFTVTINILDHSLTSITEYA